jgi:hypothetical protein
VTSDVSVKTAQRWKVGETRMPTTAKMMLAGDLGCFDPAWLLHAIVERLALVAPRYGVLALSGAIGFCQLERACFAPLIHAGPT